MPFIVTTKRRLSCSCWGTVGEDESGMCQACHKGGESASRRAVATLEEVHDVIGERLREHGVGEITVVPDLMMIGDRGGTLPPMSDGTVIEVEPVDWAKLGYLAGMRDRVLAAHGDSPAPFPPHDEILAAYNAKQASRAE